MKRETCATFPEGGGVHQFLLGIQVLYVCEMYIITHTDPLATPLKAAFMSEGKTVLTDYR